MDFENEYCIHGFDRHPSKLNVSADTLRADVHPATDATRHAGSTDALYLCFSGDHQTTEIEFESLLQVAQCDGSRRDWHQIQKALARILSQEELFGESSTMSGVAVAVAEDLARQFVYVDQVRSSKVGAKARPLLKQMKRDSTTRKFDRLLVWNLSRLGRNMRELIATVNKLANHGVTIFPVKSQTGPISPILGKALWTIQSLYAELESEEDSESIDVGLRSVRADGAQVGRRRVVFDREEAVRLRDEDHKSWSEIEKALGVSSGTIRRAYKELKANTAP